MQMPHFLLKLLSFFTFGKVKPKKETVIDKEKHLPMYWPEVVDLLEDLNKLLDEQTIDDPNIRHINQRILEYLQDQINLKGTLPNLEQRYYALDSVADRFLTNSLSKLVGLKHAEDTQAEFSDIINNFKRRLQERHQAETNKN